MFYIEDCTNIEHITLHNDIFMIYLQYIMWQWTVTAGKETCHQLISTLVLDYAIDELINPTWILLHCKTIQCVETI